MADVESRAMIKTVLDTVALPTYAETCWRKRKKHESAHVRSDNGYEDAMVKQRSEQRADGTFFEEPGRLNKEVSAEIATGRRLVQMQHTTIELLILSFPSISVQSSIWFVDLGQDATQRRARSVSPTTYCRIFERLCIRNMLLKPYGEHGSWRILAPTEPR
jgi:hypothetical protein